MQDDVWQHCHAHTHTRTHGVLTPARHRLPLRVFTGGNLCHPYLSLSYLDALSQPCVRGYLIGATNVLFKQKRGVADVVVQVSERSERATRPTLLS